MSHTKWWWVGHLFTYVKEILDIGPEHLIMINRRHILHRFKLRQNAPLGDLFIFNSLSSSNFQLSDLVFKILLAVPTFSEKEIPGGGTPNPTILSKLYFAHAIPLVTDFARMQPRRLKLPNILENIPFRKFWTRHWNPYSFITLIACSSYCTYNWHSVNNCCHYDTCLTGNYK